MTTEMLQYVIVGLLGVLSLCVSIIGFFGIRTLAKIDANQTRLFERQDALEKEFYELRGEHKSMHGRGK